MPLRCCNNFFITGVQPTFGLVHSFYFNTSGLDNNNTVIDAKLVFLVDQSLAVSHVNVSLRWGVVSENRTKLEPLTWKMVKLRKRFSLNVKMAVKNWMTNPKALGKLEMRARMQLGSSYRRQILPRTMYQKSKMPCIIVFVSYSEAKRMSSALLNLLNKHTVLLPRSLPVVSSTKFDSVKLITAKSKAGLRTQFFYPSCHKSSLSVDLTKLFSWVLKPSDPVSIGLCSGLCYSPIPSSLQPTKHAIIISLLLGRRGVRQPNRPHCVPLELTGLKVIFIDQDNRTIKVQVWDNMIVKKCGCR